jgi:hypothetical protein
MAVMVAGEEPLAWRLVGLAVTVTVVGGPAIRSVAACGSRRTGAGAAAVGRLCISRPGHQGLRGTLGIEAAKALSAAGGARGVSASEVRTQRISSTSKHLPQQRCRDKSCLERRKGITSRRRVRVNQLPVEGFIGLLLSD